MKKPSHPKVMARLGGYKPGPDPNRVKNGVQSKTVKQGNVCPEQNAVTILLIDDEDMVIQVGTKMLARLGYKVLTAEGGKAAIKLFSEMSDEIDVVILDLIMPDMDAGMIMKRLKAIDPLAKIILASGYNLDIYAKTDMASNCIDFIQKPFTLGTLQSKIKAAVG